MSEERFSRIGWLCGVLFVVLELGGFIVGSAAGRATATLGDSPSKIVNAFADPVGNGVWVGAYMELVSLAAFALFAAWLWRSQRGPLATAALLGVSAYIAVTATSLVIGDVLEYRAGHGMGAQQILTLFDVQSGLYVASWGIAAGILLLAPVSGWLRRSALVIAALGFVGMAFPKGSPGQFSAMLFLIWILVASIVLGRRSHAPRALASSIAPQSGAHALRG
jgi:hypothetical protein